MSISSSATLNEVDLDAVVGLVKAIQDEPEVAATTWSAEVRWNGGFQSEARIREFAPVPSDEPVALGVPTRRRTRSSNCSARSATASPSATRRTLRSPASPSVTFASSSTGDLDLRAFLGLREGHAGFDGIHVAVHLDADVSPDQLQQLHDTVVGTSPVGHTLARAVPVTIDLA